MSPSERATRRAVRRRVPRSSHDHWSPDASGRNPVLVLQRQDSRPIDELLPIRHDRMLASPLAFFRGAAAVMAEDLARTPVSGLRAQACGDAHLMNFGIYATPERRLVFDVNDFEETLSAPFEWDVKRLATSVVLAGRQRALSPALCERAARAAASGYRSRILASVRMCHLDVWYARLDVNELLAMLRKAERRRLESGVIRKAKHATSLGALEKLTARIDGRRRIVDVPPLIEHLPELRETVDAALVVRRFRGSLSDETAVLIGRYKVID